MSMSGFGFIPTALLGFQKYRDRCSWSYQPLHFSSKRKGALNIFEAPRVSLDNARTASIGQWKRHPLHIWAILVD